MYHDNIRKKHRNTNKIGKIVFMLILFHQDQTVYGKDTLDKRETNLILCTTYVMK